MFKTTETPPSGCGIGDSEVVSMPVKWLMFRVKYLAVQLAVFGIFCICRINCIFNPSESFRNTCIKEQEGANKLLKIHTPLKKQI